MAKVPVEDKLEVRWSKKERALLYVGYKTDGGWLSGAFEHERTHRSNDGLGKELSFVEKLEERGFDPKTLRFSIQKNMDHPRWKK